MRQRGSMETNLQLIIKTTTDLSGLDKLTGGNAKASKSTEGLDKAQKSQAGSAKAASGANGGLAQSLGGLAAKLAAAAAAYLSFNVLVKDAINLAGIQRKADSNLMSALANSAKSRGLDAAAAKKQYTQIKQLASAKQEELGIGDEVLQQAARQYVTAGASIDQMDRLLTVTADVAQATGVDAPQAAKELSKMFTNLGGAVSQLREKGIAFDKSEVELIQTLEKTNKKAEAQQLILKKLEGAYGGTAKGAMQDIDAEAKKLGNTFGDFQETLGNLWAAMRSPASKDLKGTFEGLINVFSSPSAKKFVSTLSGVAGAVGEFGKLTIGPVLEKIGQLFVKIADEANKFFTSLQSLGGGGAIALGILTTGFKLVADLILDTVDAALKLGKAFSSLLTFNPAEIKKSIDELWASMSGGVGNLKKNLSSLIDIKELEKKGAEAGKAIGSKYVKNFNDTLSKLDRSVNTAPQVDVKGATDAGTETGSLFSEGLTTFLKDNASGIQGTIGSIFDLGNAFSGLFTLGLDKLVDNTEQDLANLESRYASLYDTISEKQAALAEQEALEAEQKQERALADTEAELERLSMRTNAYLSAEEKKKWRELQRTKEALKAEKARAAEEKQLAEEKAALDKQLADERAAIEFVQNTANWENQKNTFEANKQQNLFSAGMSMAQAPIVGTLAILQAGAQAGLAGVLAMTAAATGMIANVISGAVQLASTASQKFTVPPPVKAFYGGGIVPLEEGNRFLMGGAMGMEEMATVRGGNLYIDDAGTTKNKMALEGSGGTTIVIQNMTVQTDSPEQFAQQLKNLSRRERYL